MASRGEGDITAPKLKHVNATIFLRPYSHIHIYNAASLHCFSLLQSEHSSKGEPCSRPWGALCQLAYVSVVSFNSCGSVDVCTRPMRVQMWDCVCSSECKYEFKRFLLQLTTQTCYFLSPQEAFGEMPGIPPHKNRTDHGVASGSSVAHVTGHAHTQVHAHNTQKKTQTALQR